MILGTCSPFIAPSSESLPLENAQRIGCSNPHSIGTILLPNSQNKVGHHYSLQTDGHQQGLFSKEMAPPLLPITKPSQPPSAGLSSALPMCQGCSSLYGPIQSSQQPMTVVPKLDSTWKLSNIPMPRSCPKPIAVFFGGWEVGGIDLNFLKTPPATPD